MKNLAIRRPGTLNEVAAESASVGDFGYNLKDFLHEFERDRQRQQPLAPRLAEEPPRLAGRFKEGNICDAFLAATADYLSRANGLTTPDWALAANRVLEEPWFSLDSPRVRLLLLRDTPSAFKDRNLFIFESALKVA